MSQKDKPMVLVDEATVVTLVDFLLGKEGATDAVVAAAKKLESNLNHHKRVLYGPKHLLEGDIVEPKTGKNNLRAGNTAYGQAVVLCTDPFILGSEDGEMIWEKDKPSHYHPIGEVATAKLNYLKHTWEIQT